MYTDVMIDIETTGLLPDRNAILQIAAVRFNLKENTVDGNVFNMCLEIPKHRSWDEGTRHWWSQQNQETLKRIIEQRQDWKLVMTELCKWAAPAGSLRFWSKPSHFDYMFLSSYFHDADLPQMFSYREASDMNTFIRGLYKGLEVPDLGIKIEQSAAHDALNDVFHQIELLMSHYNNVMKHA